jgi:hypothetical protein
MLGEATLDVSGTFLGEAIRLLILFAAQHTEPVLDIGELLACWPLALREADDEVIAFVGLAAGVAGLGCQDLFDRPAGVVGLAVADPCPDDLFALMGFVQYVSAEAGPARRIDSPSGVEDISS